MAEQLVAQEVPGLAKLAAPLDPTTPGAKGLAFLRQARRTVLTQHMRAADDELFQKELLQLRDTQCETPVSRTLVDSLREVSEADLFSELRGRHSSRARALHQRRVIGGPPIAALGAAAPHGNFHSPATS